MRRATGISVGAAILTVLAGCGDDSSGDSAPVVTVVVENGTLIDGTGVSPVPDAVVLVEDGLITAAGRAGDIAVPETAEVIDAGGGTILPGLVDTHVHHLNNLEFDGEELDSTGVDRALAAPLRSGVTAYRDLGSPFGDSRDLSALRNALQQQGSDAPTVVTSGPLLAAEGNYALDAFPDQAVAVPDGPAAAALVDELLDAGVDQIKLMVEHWEFRTDPTPSLTADQIAAMSDAAHARDTWVVAHVSDVAEARMALDGDVDELTHWPGPEPLPDDLIDELVARDIPVGTTFAIITPADGDVRRLLDAGGVIVLSSDAPGATSTLAISRELFRMVGAGMTPMEAIVASTRDAARALGLVDRIGTITEGKEADIIIVDGDPLDDIAVLARIAVVINDGAVVHERNID